LSRRPDYKIRRIQDSTGEIIPTLQNLLRKKEESFPRTTEFRSRAEVPAIQLRSTIIIEPQDIVTDQVIDQADVTKLAYPRISKNSTGCARGVAAPLTQRRTSCEFPDPEGIGKMPIRSIAHCTTAGESAGTNSLKRLVPRLKSAIAAGETEISNLHKTFPDLLLQAQQRDAFVSGER